ncbi:DUF4262 domain-containing protein [Amycolatopsis samaneae]|uniref:DUF4262 domain-containing protein n=1 Tax=Amycolatopsis samaneae TaxID=664691 RepID=A0ABW5GKC6_9PSEU
MCWQCEHPDQGRADYLRQVRDVIDRLGWMVQGVSAAAGSPPWAYTIGLMEKGLPELVVTGLPLVLAAGLLNTISRHTLHAGAPEPGERIALRDVLELEVVALAEPSVHLVMAVGLYGPAIWARQLVYPDDNGVWPWDPGFRDGKGGQPVLGERSRP